MKKLISLLVAAIMIAPAITAGPVSDKEAKVLRKEAKQKAKDLKKQGYDIFASSRTLEGAINSHYEKLIEMGDDVQEYSGTATRCKSKSMGTQMASNDAAIKYATQQSMDLEGKLISEGMINDDDSSAESNKFLSAYKAQVQKEIKGDMTPSYQLIKTNPDGTFEIQVYYLVSASAASKARVRAYEEAAKESEAAQKWASKVSKFIDEK